MTTTIDSPSRTTHSPGGNDMRSFIEEVLRDQHGNAVMAVPGGRHPDGKPIINRPRWFRYPEQIADMVTFSLEHAHEDLYLSPLVYGDQQDDRGRPSRAKENALTSQTIYMDSDSCPPERFRLKPSIHVETSSGHGHDYWILPEPIPAEQAADIAHRITTAHKADGTDATGWSPNKFLRMPTVNLSYGEPFPITWHETGELYSPDDIAGAYDDVTTTPQPQAPALPATAPKPKASTSRPDLLPKDSLAPLYDRVPASNIRLADLLNHEPKAGETGWRSEQRWALLLELLRAGFSDQEAMSIAWHAAASGKWWTDPRGIDGLWYELGKARVQVDAETGKSVAPADREVDRKAERIKLVTKVERERIIGERTDFLDEYLRWAASRVPVMNTPLHEINAWTLLSVAYSEVGKVWKQTGPMALNLYSISIAESSSGKTEAAKLMRSVIAALYPHDHPGIGVDQSRNALIERLVERDGQVTYAWSDEADAVLRTQKDAQWAQGVQQTWTEVYDGEIPQLGRVGKKELRRSDMTATVVSHMIGTPQGMYDVLDREMFKSGYLVRHVWARGIHIPVTEDSIKMPRPGDRRAKPDHMLMPRTWARRIAHQRLKIMGPNAIMREVHFTDEAAERIDKARWAITKDLDALGDPDIFRPMGRRMLDIQLKACALIALSDGRIVVTKRDALLATTYVETWLNEAIEVVSSVASSAFSRACDEIEAYVAGREGREAEASKVYSLMKGKRPRDVDEYVSSLIAQGRLEAIQPQSGGPRRFKIKGRTTP